MPSFQILDSNNNPISLNELDNQAASFWNVLVDNSDYAVPYTSENDFIGPDSWYTMLGFIITSFKSSNWDELISKWLGDRIITKHKSYYINLMNHWKSLGYTPVTL